MQQNNKMIQKMTTFGDFIKKKHKNKIKIGQKFVIFYAEQDKDPYEAKYHFLINKRESTGLKHFKYSKAFIECSMIQMIFTKILKNNTKTKNVKY